MGRDAVGIVGDMLESLGLWPFTAHLGWSFAAFTQLMQEVRAELQNDELKLYIPMWVVLTTLFEAMLTTVKSHCCWSPID